MMYDPNLLLLIQKNQEDRLSILEIQDILDELGVPTPANRVLRTPMKLLEVST
jgi:hypothetical protein